MSRNPLLSPFAVDSIWNTPIGSRAIYVNANIEWAAFGAADVDHFYVLNPDDPLQPLFAIGNWGPGRSSGTFYQNIALPLPEDFVIPDATSITTPNNSTAFLMPDGRTLVQVNALTRDRPGGFVYGWRAPDEDIYGDGIEGGHAGSGLSSIGGTIRRGALTTDEPIRHALKLNLQASRYLSFTPGPDGGLGYRWPATRADGYATPTIYGGTTPGLMMGTLLAIPPNVTPESLGLETPAGRKIFQALQDYGGYVVDETAFDAHGIAIEVGVKEEFEAYYGYSFEGSRGPFYRDFMRVFSALHVIANNGPNNIGGGGTPRVAPVADFDTQVGNHWQGDRTDNDYIGNENSDTLHGRGGSDVLWGQGGNDYLRGGRGNDQLEGGGGNDFLYGDDGDDLIRGGTERDYLDGGNGNDTLKGSSGDDYLSGWGGNDVLMGGLGFDVMVETNNDFSDLNSSFVLSDDQLIILETDGKSVDTFWGIERIILGGDDGNNVMDAMNFNIGTVILQGGRGNDILRGGAQSDTLKGGSGDDVLNGRGTSYGYNAIDILIGGPGQDRFVLGNHERHFYGDTDPSTPGWTDYAWIQDFNPFRDVLQLWGDRSHYFLSDSPIASIPGYGIFGDSDRNGIFNSTDELIAIVQSASPINLTTNAIYRAV